MVNAIRHAWLGYERYAFGGDELKPISKTAHEWLGLGVTILDSLDVLHMAGLRDELSRGIHWIEANLNIAENSEKISVFETTIRALGGLLAAYEMLGDDVLLRKANELGDRLARAFTSTSGLPYASVSLSTGQHSAGRVLLAEVGSVQLEFASLAAHTKRDHFRALAIKAFDVLDATGTEAKAPGGRLWPVHVNGVSGKSEGSHISWGGMGDSFYEYLLKYWLLTGKKHDKYKRMYLESVRGLTSTLVEESAGLTYVLKLEGGHQQRQMEHLACFIPGMLALGAQHIPEVREQHMELAEKLAHTCYEMYARQPTGLAPENVVWSRGGSMHPADSRNILRPEVVESIFYMWRFTKQPKYREWGWKIFRSFEKYCRLPEGGYAGLLDVADPRRTGKDDMMMSFWIAETLKYLLMLFSDDSVLDLSTHVLTTEAHPLKVLVNDSSLGDADASQTTLVVESAAVE